MIPVSAKVIIHVGYGKTATSWLQQRIFSQLPKEIYLGKRENDFPRWLIEINYLDEMAYAMKKDSIKACINEKLLGKELTIISSEAFTNLSAIHQQAHRIYDLFEDPYIILVLRHPINWLVSNYKYCVEHEGFFLNFEEYLDFGEHRTPFALEKRPPFYIPDFFYDETIKLYRELFDEKHLLVMKYEDLKSDPAYFGDCLSSYIGVKLQDFKRKSEIKLLKSKSDKEINILKIHNFHQLIKKTMGNYLPRSVFETTFGIDQPLILDDTRDKLTSIFKDHCDEYYPELHSE